ncbi:MAG: hypothetical protein LBU81_07180 [Methanosarcinales archaeon]|jgi:hypothetical protein|nr:hypothetical protein [Methanosarcinales archaeon]
MDDAPAEMTTPQTAKDTSKSTSEPVISSKTKTAAASRTTANPGPAAEKKTAVRKTAAKTTAAATATAKTAAKKPAAKTAARSAAASKSTTAKTAAAPKTAAKTTASKTAAVKSAPKSTARSTAASKKTETHSIPVNAEDEWEEIDINIDLNEINEILGEKISSGKKVLKEKEIRYTDMLKAYRDSKKKKKESKKEKKKGKCKCKKLSKDEKYIVYGVIAVLTAYIACRFFGRRK